MEIYPRRRGAQAHRRAELEVASQALYGNHRRREVSEDSLSRIDQALLAPSEAGGAARKGESTSTPDRVGGGRGALAGGNSVEEN